MQRAQIRAGESCGQSPCPPLLVASLHVGSLLPLHVLLLLPLLPVHRPLVGPLQGGHHNLRYFIFTVGNLGCCCLCTVKLSLTIHYKNFL